MKKILLLCLFLNVLCADTISLEHTKSINNALEKVFHVTHPDSIERLTKGLSSPGLYKITLNGKAYVVRFAPKIRSLEDKLRELNAMEIAAAIGLAPAIVFADSCEGLLIMDFIETSGTLDLKLLAVGMRKIHEGPPFAETIMSVFDVIDYFMGRIGGALPTLTEAFALAKQLQSELTPLMIKKPCHQDLNPNNILFSEGRVYIIDWELAGQGDPFFDLATPIVLYSLNEQAEKTFLDGYFLRELLPEEAFKLNKMKKFALIYYGLALISISQKNGEQLLSEVEIQSLPCIQELVKEGFPQCIQRLGFAYLRQAIL